MTINELKRADMFHWEKDEKKVVEMANTIVNELIDKFPCDGITEKNLVIGCNNTASEVGISRTMGVIKYIQVGPASRDLCNLSASMAHEYAHVYVRWFMHKHYHCDIQTFRWRKEGKHLDEYLADCFGAVMLGKLKFPKEFMYYHFLNRSRDGNRESESHPSNFNRCRLIMAIISEKVNSFIDIIETVGDDKLREDLIKKYHEYASEELQRDFANRDS